MRSMGDSIFPDPQKQAAAAQKRGPAPDPYLRFTGKLKAVSDLQSQVTVTIPGATLFGPPSAPWLRRPA